MDNLIEGRSYRIVVQRSPLKDKDGKQQTDMFGVIYTYRCILTNDWVSTEKAERSEPVYKQNILF